MPEIKPKAQSKTVEELDRKIDEVLNETIPSPRLLKDFIDEVSKAYHEAHERLIDLKEDEKREENNKPATHQEIMGLKSDIGQVLSNRKKDNEFIVEALNQQSRAINSNDEASVKAIKEVYEGINLLLKHEQNELGRCFLILGLSMGLCVVSLCLFMASLAAR